MKDLYEVAGYAMSSMAEEHTKEFGIEFARDMTIEEASEFIQALCKSRREPKSTKVKDNLNEEAADLLIMMNELMVAGLLDTTEIRNQMVKKYRHQKDCIEQHRKEKTRTRHTVSF